MLIKGTFRKLQSNKFLSTIYAQNPKSAQETRTRAARDTSVTIECKEVLKMPETLTQLSNEDQT